VIRIDYTNNCQALKLKRPSRLSLVLSAKTNNMDRVPS
jgi:hypothetical protein